MTAFSSTAAIMAPETTALEGLLRDEFAHAGPARVEVLDRVDSTSRYLLEDVSADALPRAGRVCLAREQTAGRGRRGRDWVGHPEDGIALSVAWPLEPGEWVPPAWPVGAGLVLSETLHELGYAAVGLKWPNDLVVGEAKLGGILVEQQAPRVANGVGGRLVAGVGLNRAGSQRLQLGRAVTDLAAQGVPPPGWLELAGRLAASLLRAHPWLMAHGLSQAGERLGAVDVLAGQRVERLETGERFLALGIDPQAGTLRVRDEQSRERGGEQALHSGEVSVRRWNHAE